MPTPKWAEKEQRRDGDNRREARGLQWWLAKRDAYAELGGLVGLVGLLIGVGSAFGLTTIAPALNLVGAGIAGLAFLGFVLLGLFFSAKWREGLITRHIALPALLAFGGFVFVIVLEISK